MQITRKLYGGFRLDDTLASRIRFTAIIRVAEIEKIVKPRQSGDIEYWSVKDDNGARFTTWVEEISKTLKVFGVYAVSGDVKIGKGGTFLNITKAEEMRGEEYEERHSNET